MISGMAIGMIEMIPGDSPRVRELPSQSAGRRVVGAGFCGASLHEEGNHLLRSSDGTGLANCPTIGKIPPVGVIRGVL